MSDELVTIEETTTVRRINPQGYNYRDEPTNQNPFWDVDYEHNLTASAEIDDTTGTPSVEVTSETDGAITNLNFAFSGLKGETGEPGTDGVTPNITATATVDSSTGTPSVTVTKNGTEAAPAFAFNFTGLKGTDGENGTDGTDGVTPVISATATVDGTTGTPAVSVTKTGTDAAPSFAFNFTGLKGANGQDATLPTGGTAGQVLTKYGSNDDEIYWADVNQVPSTTGASAGDVLTFNGSSYNWGTPSSGGETFGYETITIDTSTTTGSDLFSQLAVGDILNVRFTTDTISISNLTGVLVHDITNGTLVSYSPSNPFAANGTISKTFEILLKVLYKGNNIATTRYGVSNQYYNTVDFGSFTYTSNSYSIISGSVYTEPVFSNSLEIKISELAPYIINAFIRGSNTLETSRYVSCITDLPGSAFYAGANNYNILTMHGELDLYMHLYGTACSIYRPTIS